MKHSKYLALRAKAKKQLTFAELSASIIYFALFFLALGQCEGTFFCETDLTVKVIFKI